ncbi:MAG: methylated-DNA--[protein]-cysteine S-methyltransferase [Pirellulales bacterium]
MTQVTLRATLSDKSAARRRQVEDIVAVAFETELGWMALAHRGEMLAGVVFGHASKRQAMESLRQKLGCGDVAPAIVDFLDFEELAESMIGVVERLRAYAAGEQVDLSDVRVDERHLTDFGRRIVRACRRIPRGTTRSYGQLAADCGSPGAARAVGQVMAKNRYPLIVPCHRVLAAGGLLGGFSAPQGLAMKRRLLMLEDETLYARRRLINT